MGPKQQRPQSTTAKTQDQGHITTAKAGYAMTIPGTTWHLDDADTFPKAVELAARLGAGTAWRFFIHKLANGKWGVWA